MNVSIVREQLNLTITIETRWKIHAENSKAQKAQELKPVTGNKRVMLSPVHSNVSMNEKVKDIKSTIYTC